MADPPPRLFIAGIATQYPAHLLGPETLDTFAARFYDVETAGLKKLLRINRSSGIETRAAISTYETGFATQPAAPTISDLDTLFREAGVDLAVHACRKALRESRVPLHDITHTVAVTCTNQGNPGYDLLVHRALGLAPTVDRMLLHGVGCAGGLCIMRAAAQIAHGASALGKPARILTFACELCTPNVRHDLAEAESCADPGNVGIAAALFSDAAAAFVLCNEVALRESETSPIFELLSWGTATLPDTMQHMTFYAAEDGFRTILTRDVPAFTKQAMQPMFSSLLPRSAATEALVASDFDWALHPGGEAILDGAAEAMHLTTDQLRASREIYRTRGNSSSPAVLAVLDKLRSYGKNRDHVVATSFGPGLAIEMAILKWCSD